MADTNITELRPGRVNDPTNALRQRRHRKRRAQSTVTAHPPRAQIAHVEKPNDIKSDVTRPGAVISQASMWQPHFSQNL